MRFVRQLVLSSLLLLSGTAFANGPEKGSISVNLTGGPITKLDVKYNISQLMGEPTIVAIYRWHSTTITEIDSDAVLWLELSDSSGRKCGFLRATPLVPDVDKWGDDTTGSPNWNECVVQSYRDKKVEKYFTAKESKTIWKDNFTVTGALLAYSYKTKKPAK